ncbi:MAG: ArnT family glycosyltransferase, partial [Sulfuricurvum sp.]
LLFMFISQYRNIALPHWISPFFLLFIPIGVYYFYLAYPKVAKTAISLSLILVIAIHLELIIKLGKFPDYQSPFRDIVGWDKAMDKASSQLIALNNPNAAFAVTHWNLASRAIIYSSKPVFLIDNRIDQFDLWQKDTPLGKDLLFINPKSYNRDIMVDYQCDNVRKLDEYNTTLNNGIVESFSYELCENFKGIR